jgi:hypothetical protein
MLRRLMLLGFGLLFASILSISTAHAQTPALYGGPCMFLCTPPAAAFPPLPWFPSQPLPGIFGCPGEINGYCASLDPGHANALAGSGTVQGGSSTSSSQQTTVCVSFTGGPCVTLCADGQWSSSTGSGTCSSHGGEALSTMPGCVSITGGPCVTLCADGSWSSSTGPGTCSGHGGEAAWTAFRVRMLGR